MIATSLERVVNNLTSGFQNNISLPILITGVHVIYSYYVEQLHWFGQLTFHQPGILATLSTTKYDDKDDLVGEQFLRS